jgi:hypothetical protein
MPDFEKTPSKVDAHIEALCKKIGPNVMFLQKGVCLIEQYKIAVIGATLWSAPEMRHWDLLADEFFGHPGLRGDYNAIFERDSNTGKLRAFHPSDAINIHMDHKYFIKQAVGPFSDVVPRDYRVIVLTHHMPTYKLCTADSPLRSNYGSDQEQLMKEPIVAWICGHGHEPKIMRFDTGTLVTMNPLGYKNEDKTRFMRTAAIVVRRENIAMPMK